MSTNIKFINHERVSASTIKSDSSAEDILRIKKKLEKMINNNDIDVILTIDMLNSLKKIQMDIEVLKNTGIGVMLNNLRKNSQSEELNSLAKSLLKNWKKLVSHENPFITTSPQSPSSKSLSTNSEKNSSARTNCEQDINEKMIYHSVNKNKLTFSHTTDPVRSKCRELLSQALEINEQVDNDYELYDCHDLASQIEDEIFSEFKNTDLKYKNRIRSRIANLKDPKNPKLRESVRLGIISSEKLAKMSSDELASDELKNLRAKFTIESINDHQMAKSDGAKSSLLSCGKCKKNNVTYNQMQTRSADEPMTTFAFCQECGHRWKFC
jgi:transcription elongation factor S-II